MTKQIDAAAEIELLSSLERGEVQTQPTLAQKAKISLGLTNALLRRAIRKGYVKARAAPRKRFVYYVTPQGFLEKSQLVATYLDHSLEFFRLVRGQYKNLLEKAVANGAKDIVFVGGGEIAEIALLAIPDAGAKPAALYEPSCEEPQWRGIQVIRDFQSVSDHSLFLITDSKHPQDCYDRLCRHFPKERILAAPFLKVSLEQPVFQPVTGLTSPNA